MQASHMHHASEDAILKIATATLGLETLAIRNCDSLDFHEMHVAQIRKALALAYQAGRQEGAAQ